MSLRGSSQSLQTRRKLEFSAPQREFERQAPLRLGAMRDREYRQFQMTRSGICGESEAQSSRWMGNVISTRRPGFAFERVSFA